MVIALFLYINFYIQARKKYWIWLSKNTMCNNTKRLNSDKFMRFSDSLDPASSSHKGVFKWKLSVYMGNKDVWSKAGEFNDICLQAPFIL